MSTVVIEESTPQVVSYSFLREKKKSFEEVCMECKAVPIEIFVNELKKRVKERYRNAKS